MKQYTRRRGLLFSYKLMLVYALTFILLVVGWGIYSYYFSIRFERERANQNFTATIRQIKDSIEYRASVIERLSEQIYLDLSLQKILASTNSEYDAYKASRDILVPKVESIVKTPTYDVHMEIYLRNEVLPEIYHEYKEVDPISPLRGRSYDIYHMSRLLNKGWYKDIDKKLGSYNFVWAQVEDDNKYRNISLVRRLVDLRDLSGIGIVRIAVKLDSLMKRAGEFKIGNSRYIIVDGNNKILFSDDNDLIDKNVDDIQLSRYFVVSEKIDSLGVKIMMLVPNTEIMQNAIAIRNTTIVACLLSIFLFFGVGFMVSRYFSRRISGLVESFQAIKNGDFSRRIVYSGRDEFSELAASFNEMAIHIQGLITEVFEAKLQKKEAQLQVLQSQINPHFLHNSLSAISRMARLGETDKLHTIVMGLARFYRLSMNTGQILIPISQEIEHVRVYLEIQQVKYLDMLYVDYEIDPDVCKYYTIHIILQPFVENCIKHAWDGDKLSITIRARIEQNNVRFDIVDDGVGMNEGVDLERIDGNSTGYGIRNVDERIKLYFGPTYGVSLSSSPGRGLCVTVRLPLIDSLQAEQHGNDTTLQRNHASATLGLPHGGAYQPDGRRDAH